MSSALDRHITTEPDNGYEAWCNEVWTILTAKYSGPTPEEVNLYWDRFFEPLTIELSTCGTRSSGGCDPDFAASVIAGRWREFKNKYKFLLDLIRGDK